MQRLFLETFNHQPLFGPSSAAASMLGAHLPPPIPNLVRIGSKTTTQETSSYRQARPDQGFLVAPEKFLYNGGAIQKRSIRDLGLEEGPICPSAPNLDEMRKRARVENLPVVKNGSKIKTEVMARLTPKKVTEPLKLEVAPGIYKMIVNITPMANVGKNSEVYLCELDTKEKWVLKFYRKPHLTIDFLANQLCRYGQNLNHPVLGNHVAQHLNFDSHLAPTRELLNIQDPATRISEFRNYVRNSVEQGFLFVRYVPNSFPEKFDREDPRCKELQKIFQAAVDARICNDLQWDNVRIDEEGHVKMIDLYEFDGEEESRDHVLSFVTQHRSSFSDAEEDQEFLFPSEKIFQSKNSSSAMLQS